MADRPPDGEGAPWTRRPFAVGVALILIAAALVTLASVRVLLLVGFLAVLVGSVLTYPIDALSRVMPRGVAVIVTVVLVGAVIFGLGWMAAPFVVGQASELLDRIPEALHRLQSWWSHDIVRKLGAAGAAAGGGGASLAHEVKSHSQQAIASAITQLVPIAFSAVQIVAGIVLLLALAFFLAYEPDSYRRGVRALMPAAREAVLDEAWNRVGRALRHWMAGILISMTIMGSLAAFGLWLAGVDGWLTLGLLTFVGTFVPYAGAIASAIPGLAAALADSPRRFLYALVVYLVVHLVEGYVVQPLIMKRAVELRPALLLFWQLVMGGLFGVIGVIAATPLLACVTVAVDYLWVERHLGKPPGERAP